MLKLNLGCGRDIKESYVNCDCHSAFGADKVFNLNKFPYPFKNNSADEILLNHVLEHLDKPTDVINECHRILRKGGKLLINVPYDNQYGDIHKQNFLVEFFYFFAHEGIPAMYKKERIEKTRGSWEHSAYKRFSKIELKLIFPKGLHFYNYLIEPFANRLIKTTPAHYQQTMLKALFPANAIKISYTK